ncbi:MAG: DUF1624 domain-containing protein [Candidatus Paracaedibacteraceae bacterium]|nr:DUF1624 domain-containing protein [Candidatus Paracaedibacteraceae bacterium]
MMNLGHSRRLEIDVLRGVFCILVTWVHVTFFVGGRSLGEVFFDTTHILAMADSFYIMWVVSEQLAPVGFFVLLGAALALSQSHHESFKVFLRHNFKRGVFIMVLGLIIRPLWLLTPLDVLDSGPNQGAPIFFVFGVYLNLGVSIIICTLLSRVPSFYLVTIGITGLIWSGLVDVFDDYFDNYHSVIASIFLLPGINSGVKTTFNIIPWASFSILGLSYGRLLINRPEGETLKELFLAAVLIISVVLARLLEKIPEERFWFVSKYPPNLFLSGGAIVFILVLLNIFRLVKNKKNRYISILEYIGQNSLLFYSLHFPFFILLGVIIKYVVGEYVQNDILLHFIWLLGLWCIYRLALFCSVKEAFKAGMEWRWPLIK